jgi:hypothetical protein
MRCAVSAEEEARIAAGGRREQGFAIRLGLEDWQQ